MGKKTKQTVSIVYNTQNPEKINETLDREIIKALEFIGLKWYASGVNLESGDRDLAFDLNYHHSINYA